MADESQAEDRERGVEHSNTDDNLIVSQVVGGQKDLFRLLIRQYERAVYGMGRSFFRNPDDASDFVQEVFIKAYRSLAQFEGRSRFSTWLYKIAYNTAVNELPRRKEYRSLAEEDTKKLSDSDTPERALLRNAAREAVQNALK